MQAPQHEEMTRFGLYGVIPFIVAAVALWLSPILLPQHIALDFHQFTLIYGGVIVVYLSGVSAGSMLNTNSTHSRSYVPGLLIVLVALLVMLPSGTFFFVIDAVWRHLIILLLLIYLLLRDLNDVRAGLLPSWYGNLRTRQTLWVSLSMALIMVRLFVWGFY